MTALTAMPASSIAQSSATTCGRARSGARSVAKREANGLNGVQASTDQKKRQRSRGVADPKRPGRVAGEDQQRERHDREAAELRHRAEPDERHAPPAEHGAMMVGAEADQRAQRRGQQRQR